MLVVLVVLVVVGLWWVARRRRGAGPDVQVVAAPVPRLRMRSARRGERL